MRHPLPGHPPRPLWLRDILTAVVLAEMSSDIATESESNKLYEAARDLYKSAAEQVALEPAATTPAEGAQPLGTPRPAHN